MSAKIKLAVVTGGHPFPVPAFRDMFNRMEQCDTYIQDLDNWVFSKRDGTYDTYDAFLFYNMHYWGKFSVRNDMDQRITDALAELGESKQGIIVLHHALLSFLDLQSVSDVINVQNRKLRGFGARDIRTQIAFSDHPITHGLDGWEMKDEFFVIDPPGDKSKVLLTTDHPESMKTLGWVHEHKNARVFCYQSGHGETAYTNPTFQKVLSRGVEWVAGRI